MGTSPSTRAQRGEPLEPLTARAGTGTNVHVAAEQPPLPELIWVQIWNTTVDGDGHPGARPDWTRLCGKVLDAVFATGASIRFSGEGTDLAMISAGLSGPGGHRVDLPPFEHHTFAVAATCEPGVAAQLHAALEQLCAELGVQVMWVASNGALRVLRNSG